MPKICSSSRWQCAANARARAAVGCCSSAGCFALWVGCHATARMRRRQIADGRHEPRRQQQRTLGGGGTAARGQATYSARGSPAREKKAGRRCLPARANRRRRSGLWWNSPTCSAGACGAVGCFGYGNPGEGQCEAAKFLRYPHAPRSFRGRRHIRANPGAPVLK
ncbi:unnamed protein product [Amoebophrya sp. A120]|nr:unnamed protein product [Amoebophrya sp. A120]|eukprot:GSA120T00011670001.1